MFREYNQLNLTKIHKEILSSWNSNCIFNSSIDIRKDNKEFTFYEGPPSANGQPGIHHVIARTIKDLFCRYKTLKGFKVNRKAGWDTHGLPVELGVEKELNITKDDIGNKISIQEYNDACRSAVMRYKTSWEKITSEMGYWVDMKNPYITYHNKYIESVWWLLSKIHEKNLLYKGYTIQPYSPKAGTGLSTHELNQPGCYRKVKDTSATAQFKIINDSAAEFLFKLTCNDIFFLAWTTTPWTLPSNTALAVGKDIDYCLIETINRYTNRPITIILAKQLFNNYFNIKNNNLKIKDYDGGDKLPYKILSEFKGSDLDELRYEQLFKYAKPTNGDCFKVITADFVTTESGTGIVHLAPSFGADDNIVAKQKGIGSLTLVNKSGKFVKEVSDFAGMYVKNEFYDNEENAPELSVDVQITIKLKKENRCFKSEKYEHSYPHCWRTDKPILYYPLDSWFIKTTDYKARMKELNSTINWKPKSTGKGRFGNWLDNLVDWNLSRSRFWGIPIPIWRTEKGDEEICIGSIKQLKQEIEKSISKGFMKKNPLEKFENENFTDENYKTFDLHRPHVDNIILVSKNGYPMKRELDLIDVWFDSGAMPYAQLHYPFENKLLFENNFPADFIAEGVDQTRGWFFTLHAISTILFDSVAYKNVISNGLVLDKNGNKMSKRLGNSIDPFKMLNDHGADATRWYMISNAQPWENLRFDEDGIKEVKRKLFGTLYNTYSFFALYANIDGFTHQEVKINSRKRTEIDRWIISELNSLIQLVEIYYDDYEPNRAARAIQEFVLNKLSNWYVRLSRRRFWKEDYNNNKISAYQTLYECLEKIAIISSPIAPFFMDQLFLDLNHHTEKYKSVHLTDFPKVNKELIDHSLERRMRLAQNITSLCLSLRKREKIRVRQPLSKIMVPVLDKDMEKDINQVSEVVLSEINVKKIEYIDSNSNYLTKKIKPNYKVLGPKYGKDIKLIASTLSRFNNTDIKNLEITKSHTINKDISISLDDVEITSSDIPGCVVASNDGVTVALDVTISKELKEEGIARELVNRIQNIRKNNSFNVTDKINILLENNELLLEAVQNNLTYICDETLAENLSFKSKLDASSSKIELIENITANVIVNKID